MPYCVAPKFTLGGGLLHCPFPCGPEDSSDLLAKWDHGEGDHRMFSLHVDHKVIVWAPTIILTVGLCGPRRRDLVPLNLNLAL